MKKNCRNNPLSAEQIELRKGAVRFYLDARDRANSVPEQHSLKEEVAKGLGVSVNTFSQIIKTYK